MALSYAEATMQVTGVILDGETIGAAGVTYTWRNTVSTTALEVKIGATTQESLQNLFDAFNATGSPGVQYGSLTVAHAHLKAVAIESGNTVLRLRARIQGQIGNRLATSVDTMVNGSWTSGSFCVGGSGSIHDDVNVILATMQMPSDIRQALLELVNVQSEV